MYIHFIKKQKIALSSYTVLFSMHVMFIDRHTQDFLKEHGFMQWVIYYLLSVAKLEKACTSYVSLTLGLNIIITQNV